MVTCVHVASQQKQEVPFLSQASKWAYMTSFDRNQLGKKESKL